MKLRLAIGRFSTASRLTVNERSPLEAWMADASPVTLTVSASVPTSITRAPIAYRSPALTGTPLRLSVLKPSIVIWIV